MAGCNTPRPAGRSGAATLGLLMAGLLLLAPAQAQAQSGLNYVTQGADVFGMNSFQFQASCPAGSVAYGGGYDSQGVAVDSTAPGSSSWQVSGFGETNVGDLKPTASAACAPEEAAAVSLGSAPFLNLYPRLQDKDPHFATSVASCPAGTVAVSGGFSLEAVDNSGDGGPSGISVASSQPSPNLGGWQVDAKNLLNLQQLGFNSSVACMDATVAGGIFGIYVTDPIETTTSLGDVTATCTGGGQPISGGVSATDPKSDDPFYGGLYTTLDYTDGYDGVNVSFNAGSFADKTVSATVICGTYFPLLKALTQADFDTACQSSLPAATGVKAIAGPQAIDWQCVSDQGGATSIPGNQGAWACQWLFPGTRVTAVYLNLNDPLSWQCYDTSGDGALEAQRTSGDATGLSGGAKEANVRTSGRLQLDQNVNLNKSDVVLARLLHEASDEGELFKRGRREALPASLGKRKQTGRARKGNQTVVYKSKSGPRIRLTLRKRNHGKVLRYGIRARRARLAQPRQCDPGPRATTNLETRISIDPKHGRAFELSGRSYWQCSADRLRVGRPAMATP